MTPREEALTDALRSVDRAISAYVMSRDPNASPYLVLRAIREEVRRALAEAES